MSVEMMSCTQNKLFGKAFGEFSNAISRCQHRVEALCGGDLRNRPRKRCRPVPHVEEHATSFRIPHRFRHVEVSELRRASRVGNDIVNSIARVLAQRYC